jgi:DNA-binding NarL/FixJ family response regulator
VPLKILLADDHHVMRQALKVLLEQRGFAVVGEAADGLEAVRQANEKHPDVAVLDLSMPLLNGIDAAKQIRHDLPSMKMVLLTMHSDEQYILEAIRAGITGYVLKNEAATDLVKAIQDVNKGLTHLSTKVSRAVVKGYLDKTKIPADPLSPRERQVLQLIAEGKTTKEVANLLGVSAKTADSHRTRIMKKLDMHGTAELVRYAIRTGLLQP